MSLETLGADHGHEKVLKIVRAAVDKKVWRSWVTNDCGQKRRGSLGGRGQKGLEILGWPWQKSLGIMAKKVLEALGQAMASLSSMRSGRMSHSVFRCSVGCVKMKIQREKMPANRKQGDKMPANRKQGEKMPANRKQGEKMPANTKQGEKMPANTKQGEKKDAS